MRTDSVGMKLPFWERFEKLNEGNKGYLFAGKLAIPASTLSTWKTKSRFPPADDAVKIAEALGTTVEYLVTGKGPEPPAMTDYMMAAETSAQGYATGEYSQVVEDLKILDDQVRAGFIAAIHHTAECIRREKNRQGGSAAG